MFRQQYPVAMRFSRSAPVPPPMGDMELQRVTRSLSPWALAAIGINTPAVIADAWTGSDWWKRVAATEELRGLAEPIQRRQRAELPFASRMGRAMVAAAERGPAVSAWVAAVPGSLDNPTGRITYGQPVLGIGRAYTDVSGSWPERMLKRILSPEKVYACLGDVDVRPELQHGGMGIALAYATLFGLDPQRLATTYVPVANGGLVRRLAAYGFEVTGQVTQRDLLPDVAVELHRLQAGPNHEVQSRLAEDYPWLQHAEVQLGRV